MRALGNIKAVDNLGEGLLITFEIDKSPGILEALTALADRDLIITLEKFFPKKSDRANRYLWKLCEKIAISLKSDKETIYIKHLIDAGASDYLQIPRAEFDKIKGFYRYVKVDHYYTIAVTDPVGNEEYIDMVEFHAWKGSHTYDTAQMARLIDDVIEEAQALGIDTITDIEKQKMIEGWVKHEETY